MAKNTLKKIITSILGFFGIMTFTSCYGMPVNDDWLSLCGTVTGDHDGKAETPAVPVKGIKVTARYSDGKEIDSSQTGERGMYFMEIDVSSGGAPRLIEYTFEDTDGAENGSYKKKNGDKRFFSR